VIRDKKVVAKIALHYPLKVAKFATGNSFFQTLNKLFPICWYLHARGTKKVLTKTETIIEKKKQTYCTHPAKNVGTIL
jgi:hypothetical protein